MSVMASPSAPVDSSGVVCGKTSGAPVAPKRLQGAVDLVGCQVGPEEEDGHRRPSLVPAGETGGRAVRGTKNCQFLEQHLGVIGYDRRGPRRVCRHESLDLRLIPQASQDATV